MRTSPYYPQSNGKLERFHKTIKGECIRPGIPLSLDDARRMAEEFINHYNNVRLHSAIGYIAPVNKLNGRDQEKYKERDRKVEKARELRKKNRFRAHEPISPRGDNTAPLLPLSLFIGEITEKVAALIDGKPIVDCCPFTVMGFSDNFGFSRERFFLLSKP